MSTPVPAATVLPAATAPGTIDGEVQEAGAPTPKYTAASMTAAMASTSRGLTCAQIGWPMSSTRSSAIGTMTAIGSAVMNTLAQVMFVVALSPTSVFDPVTKAAIGKVASTLMRC